MQKYGTITVRRSSTDSARVEFLAGKWNSIASETGEIQPTTNTTSIVRLVTQNNALTILRKKISNEKESDQRQNFPRKRLPYLTRLIFSSAFSTHVKNNSRRNDVITPFTIIRSAANSAEIHLCGGILR